MSDINNSMLGNEKGNCHKNQSFGKVEDSILSFRELKYRLTLFLKPQFARLVYLSAVTWVSLSFNSPNDVNLSLT
jgi:hypothetical protein